jgi:ferredoxin
MTRCDAYGYCAELLPELLRVDEWGYPIILPAGLPVDTDVEHARDAVRSCPRKALFLEK